MFAILNLLLADMTLSKISEIALKILDMLGLLQVVDSAEKELQKYFVKL